MMSELHGVSVHTILRQHFACDTPLHHLEVALERLPRRSWLYRSDEIVAKAFYSC